MRAFCSALKKCKNVCPCNPQGQFGLEKGAHFGFSLFGGKPRTHRKTLGVNLTQRSREAQRKRYTLSGDTTPQSKPTVLPAPLTQGSRERSANASAAAAEGVMIYRLPYRAVLFCAEKLSNRQYSRAKQVY